MCSTPLSTWQQDGAADLVRRQAVKGVDERRGLRRDDAGVDRPGQQLGRLRVRPELAEAVAGQVQPVLRDVRGG
jgi:hypothetical protein